MKRKTTKKTHTYKQLFKYPIGGQQHPNANKWYSGAGGGNQYLTTLKGGNCGGMCPLSRGGGCPSCTGMNVTAMSGGGCPSCTGMNVTSMSGGGCPSCTGMNVTSMSGGSSSSKQLNKKSHKTTCKKNKKNKKKGGCGTCGISTSSGGGCGCKTNPSFISVGGEIPTIPLNTTGGFENPINARFGGGHKKSINKKFKGGTVVNANDPNIAPIFGQNLPYSFLPFPMGNTSFITNPMV
jgi:hypothetical protein